MKKSLFSIALAATALSLMSCISTNSAGNGGTGGKDLSSCTGSWQLVFLSKNGVAQTLAVTDLTISAEGGGLFSVSGVMGENRFTGKVSSQTAGVIKTENFASTKRGVSPELAEFESIFSEFFNGIDSYSVSKVAGEAFESLELKNSAMRASVRFVKNSIFYKKWKLTAVNDGNAVVNVDSKATMLIEKNKAVIFTGINTANLGVNVVEEKCKIAFEDGPLTRAAGSEEDMKIESFLIQNLLKAEKYSISGKTLSLYAGDTLLLEFEKQEILK